MIVFLLLFTSFEGTEKGVFRYDLCRFSFGSQDGVRAMAPHERTAVRGATVRRLRNAADGRDHAAQQCPLHGAHARKAPGDPFPRRHAALQLRVVLLGSPRRW